jgi:hypothetical protein
MKRTKKVLLWIFIILVVIAGSVAAWFFFTESKNRDPFTVIPDDAVFIIETNNLTKGWSTLSDSKMWKHMITNEHFKDISADAATLDSLIKGNETMNLVFSERELYISAHMISETDYDFIFIVDMQQASKVSFIKDYIGSILKVFDYSMAKRTFKGTEIMELTDNKTGKVVSLSFIDNLLVCSYSKPLIEAAIMQKDKENWGKKEKFKQVAGEISSKKLFNFYFNYSMLAKYMKCYMSEDDDMITSLGNSLSYSAFNVNLEDERLSFSGYTNLKDSTQTYLKALCDVSPGKMGADVVISDQASVYLAMCFDNFNDFREKLEKQYASEKADDYEDYSKKIKKVEKLFKIDLQEDFFSWIGTEIAYVMLRPNSNSKEKDMVVAINAKNIDDAKEHLNHMTNQVKKRSPVKFDIVKYKDYEINYMDIKGFFKMFFGKLFGKLEKPYFTYIDNYVVFSNSPSNLMDMIDDYIKGKTLSHNKAFTDFKENFENKANVTVFMQMTKLYSQLYFFTKPDKRKGIQNNKDLIVSFTRVGFQLVSDGKIFKTTLIVDHDPDALNDNELEKFESAAEDLFNKDYESLSFKPQLTPEQLAKEGNCKVDYSSGVTQYEGQITDGKFDGLWRSFYESGNIKSAVKYKDGKADGLAEFYYDNDRQSTKAEVVFDNDAIKDTYKEYYENGNRKAKLDYEDGKANGDAEFYYDSGIIKVKGKYKDGVKQGKWKFFTETGEVYNKEKWKKGNAKNPTPSDGQ